MRDIVLNLSEHFNSQPHKEADAQYIPPYAVPAYFNSQPHKEADVTVFVNDLPTESFQLTASQGG